MSVDKLKAIYRPISVIMLVFTICVLAIFDSAPTWFLAFAIPIISGLLIERGIRKGKPSE